MFLSRRVRFIGTGARLVYGFAFLAVLISCVPLYAGKQNQKPATLSEVGAALEWVRLQPAAVQKEALDNVETALRAALRSGVPSDAQSAALFLSGEIQWARGRFGDAVKEFQSAEKKDKKGTFADDAAFAAIVTMEAAGRDDEAFRAWTQWLANYAGSPLVPEARLARSWNALRLGKLAETKRTLATLTSNSPWMEKDPRVLLAAATVAYIEGRSADALAALGDAMTSPAAMYLRALCCEATGQALKAAAQYQELVERYPDSILRDRAMLAKANIFLESKAYRSAAEEFARVVERAARADVRAEAELRHATSLFLAGDAARGTDLLREVAGRYAGTDVAGRAQLLLGDVLVNQSLYNEAIVEFNRVLTRYFEHNLAASAQFRIGRCLDALGRQTEATSTYQAVVSGYPTSPEAPAAAYLAGVGLLDQGIPRAAAPYFQLVLDRYARSDSAGAFVFASREHQELVEASLCLLELSYHRAGNLGQLSGVPHLMLQKMPPSRSPWRAYALLIDADALAAQGRYDDAQKVLEQLGKEFPDHQVAIPAARLLAWTYSRQGNDDLAIATEEKMLSKFASYGDNENMSSSYLNKAHILFNRKKYKEAAATYDEYLRRFPEHPQRLLGLYQAGLCQLRLDHTGDAVDRWETLVSIDPTAEIAERAWVRAGDVYFQADHFDDAKRCYRGLLDNFANSRAAALGMLRMAQCDYNAGRDAEALEQFSVVIARYPGSGVSREAERGLERALYRLGQRDDGAQLLGELVERHPTSPFAADAQFEIAMRHYKANAFAEAAEAFRHVVSQFPSYSAADKAHFLMGDAYSQAGLAKEARRSYEQFLTFFAESEYRPTVRFRLGSLRFDEGNYIQAAVDFTTVLEEKASEEITSASLFNLALCRLMLEENDVARSALERYRAKYPQDKRAAQVARHLGEIHEKAGDYMNAGEEYKRGIASNPSPRLATELHYRLGLCREQLGTISRALEAYKEAMASKDKSDAFRLSAVARAAALYEKKGDYNLAIAAYRDLIQNAKDPELVVAAKERVTQLKSAVK